MKSTGIVRKLDELGRVVLPIELRRTMDLNIHSMTRWRFLLRTIKSS